MSRCILTTRTQSDQKIRPADGSCDRAHSRAFVWQHVEPGWENIYPELEAAHRRHRYDLTRLEEEGLKPKQIGALRRVILQVAGASLRCPETFWERSLFSFKPQDR